MKALFGVVAALAAALSACGGSDSDVPATPTDRTPATLVAVAGDVQRGPLNTALPAPLAVQVRNATGRTLQGVPVAWR